MVALIQPRPRPSAASKGRFAFTRGATPAIIQTVPAISVGAGTPTLARPIYAASAGGGSYFASQSAGSPWTVSRTLPAETTTGGIAFVSRPSITAGLQSAPTDSSLRQFSFMLEDSAFEVMTQSNGNRYFVKVDGEYVTDTLATPNTLYQTATAASQWRKFDFGTRKMRRIDIIGGGGSSDQLSFMGVAISSTGAIYPAPIRGPRVICVGDSFTINALHSWTHWLAEGMGWDDVWTSGVGGTGLLNTSGGTKKTFRQRVATDIVPFAPDIVIMHGGVNDGALGAAAAQAEATAFVQEIKAALPNCLVIGGCNISRGPETLPSTTLDLRDAVKAGFIAGGGVWLDITEQPLSGTPLSGVLSAARTAGTAGNGGTVTVPTGSTGIPCSTGLRVGATVDIGTGATRERKVITGHANASGQARYAFDGAFQYDHAIGEPIVEVGASYISGRGDAGATTGWGTADFWCKSDKVHPTEQDILSAPYTNGQYAIGRAVAGLVQGYLNTQS